jgi:putative ABC transport system permease protein
MLRLALAQIRIRPMAFAGLATALFMAETAITLFGSLFAAGVTGPAPQGNQPGLAVIGGAFGEIVVLVSFFVVASTLGFAVRQQHQELALLRIAAATPAQVRRLVRWQAAAVVLAVSPAAWAAGAVGARWFLRAVITRNLAPVGDAVPGSPLPLLIAVVVTLFIAAVAAAAAARRISRIAPSAALTEAATYPARTGWPRVLAGALALAGGTVFCAFIAGQPANKSADGALLAAFILMAGTALLGPPVAGAIVTILGTPVRLIARQAGWLADSNLRGYAHRLSSAVIPMILLVALSGTFVFVGATVSGVSRQLTPGQLSTVNSPTDVWLRQVELGVLVCFGGISTLNTLAALTAARRREFALLRLIGATRRQLARMLCAETLLIAAVGVAVGAPIAISVTAAFSQTLPGAPLPSVPAGTFGSIAGGVVALTALGILTAGPWATSGRATELVAGHGAD